MKEVMKTKPRTAYEFYLGKRVADSTWKNICKNLKDSGLEITDTNVVFYAKLREQIHIPKSVKFQEVLAAYREAERLLSTKSSKVTGYNILAVFHSQGIKPHKSTLGRWFKSLDGFRKTREYLPEKLAPVIASAYLYKTAQTLKTKGEK